MSTPTGRSSLFGSGAPVLSADGVTLRFGGVGLGYERGAGVLLHPTSLPGYQGCARSITR